MKRKDFIQKIGKGIALSTMIPIGSNVMLPKTRQNNNESLNSIKDDINRPEGYHLIWEDKFDGNSLDESEWFYRMDLKMASAQKASNVKVENGKLVLTMRKEDFLGMKYTGAGIVSKRRWQHGYYEVKAKLTNVPGWHHSFWVQEGTGFLTYSADRNMEIDVFEMEDTKASNHNVWIKPDGWSSEKKGWKSIHNKDLGFDASDGYHVYGYEYTHEGITFYVDGKKVYYIGIDEDQYKHYAINLWLTVIATHSDANGTALPANDYFEYIRCYSREGHAKPPSKVVPVPESTSPIYIDNFDPFGFNMGNYWEIATDGDSHYGNNYYKWKPRESYNPMRDWALFRPLISESGEYDIYLRWSAGEDRSARVPLEIWYDGGTKKDTSKTVDQQKHDGEWVKIGRYYLRAGWNNMIKLIANGPGYTVADAAKFVKKGSN